MSATPSPPANVPPTASQPGIFWWRGSETRPLVAACHIAFLLLIFSLAVSWVFARLDYSWNWDAAWNYREKFLRGWGLTILLSGCALVGSLITGVLAALAGRSRFNPLRYTAKFYVEIVRGSPLLVQILVLYYGIFEVAGLRDAFWGGVVILSVFSGAYIAEIVRAGIESVGKSQLESARAVGFTSTQTYRYVIFPQAVRQVLPPLAGQLASLIKDSSLLSIIAVSELTLNAQEVNAFTYSAFESYLPLALGYLILTIPISLASRELERRFRYET